MAESRRLQLRVGLLVVVGLALAVGFALFFTASRLGGSALVFETYVQESVQGLDVGAPVRYRGVAIGRVSFIGLVSAEYRRPEGEAFVGAFQLVLVRFAVDERRLGDVPSMQEAVKLGLRARIAAQGITGVNYLELDFVNPERFPPMEVPWGPEFPYVPAIPSTVAQVTSVAETLLQRLEQANIPEIISNVGRLITDLRAELDGGDLQRVRPDLLGHAGREREVVQHAGSVFGGQRQRQRGGGRVHIGFDLRRGHRGKRLSSV